MKRSLHRLLLSIALAAAAGGLYLLAERFAVQWDVTQNALNSLEPSSIEVLGKLDGPVALTVFTPEQDARQGDMRKLIRDFIGIYQRYKPDMSLTFIDPAKNPEEARQAGIQNNGEMVVRYGGRTEHLTTLSEQSLSTVLLQLAHKRNAVVMYLDTHGERKLQGMANHDLGDFGKRLEQNGYQLHSLNLVLAQDVPDNAGLLVITHPQVALLPGEMKKILRHLDNGGDLLWLLDAEPLRGLDPLAEKLGLMLPPGIVIDPAAQDMNAPFDWTLGAGYPPHPVTGNFNLLTVFPRARALELEDSEDKTWHRSVIVEGAARGWVSRTPPSTISKPRFNAERDVRGPVNLAIAFERETSDRTQRIIVVGNGNFLANAYLGNGGNADLGINMVNWLVGDEALITVQTRANRDGSIVLSKHQITALTVMLLVILPLLLVAAGGMQWWRRRK